MGEATLAAGTARAPIALLDEGTVAGIAAGEVVERPASAVKELVENSLDAGATDVRVEYDDRGKLRLVVVDDGCGIDDGEIDLALTRHATSKIRGLDDLARVSSFGFRGEALAAIAAASDLELVTSTDARSGGTRVVVRAGRIVERAPAPSRRGTRIDVQDLFASVPARRKFLRSAAAEAGFVTDAIRRFALARPDVRFTFVLSGKVALDLAPVADGAARIRQVFGKEVADAVVPLDARFGDLRLRGFVSSPGASWGSSRRMAIYVGGRFVREKLLFQSVLEGYATYLLKSRYPAVVLFLDCEGGAVDVNVHPAKLEVRFADADGVRRFVSEAVRDALRRSASPLGRWGLDATESLRRRAVPAPAMRLAAPLGRAGERTVFESSAAGDVDARPAAIVANDSAIPGYEPAEDTSARTTDGAQLAIDLGAGRAEGALGRYEVVGQIFDGYFVCEGGGEVLLVDQHAAHERILFERLTAAFAERRIAKQALLLPERVHVGRDGVEACAAARDQLDALGWEVEPFGEEDIVVRAAPAMAAGADPRILLEAVAGDLVEAGRARSAERLAERVLATVACHSAVRVGKRLDAAAARDLMREMATVPYHATCPHGRPVARKLDRGQVERLFGR